MSADLFRETIANRLKSCRKSKEMSLDAVARATEVSKAMLGQIERGESAPTIATLWKIARGLGISFSSFFTPEGAPGPALADFPDDPDMQVRVLFPFDPQTRLEIFEVTLTNHHRQRSTAHQIGLVEYVVVLRGQLELRHGADAVRLAEGDARRFHADVPHEYRAVTETAVFQNIICYT
ncbi:MAG: XRE family transcriptional regulator [Pseudodesulfovibrio sp.]